MIQSQTLLFSTFPQAAQKHKLSPYSPGAGTLQYTGSSDSFIDSVFVQTQHLPAYGIPPIKLRFIDGTSNSIISQALDLQIHLPTGESQNLTFLSLRWTRVA